MKPLDLLLYSQNATMEPWTVSVKSGVYLHILFP
jgi:hypothetical protein